MAYIAEYSIVYGEELSIFHFEEKGAQLIPPSTARFVFQAIAFKIAVKV